MVIKNGIDKALNRNSARFFMPGHNGDKSISLHYDVTELDGTDNLHFPQGIIKRALLNASVAFSSYHTFFLVNGSSVGLHALIMSVCTRGDTLIVDRSCHISVINALVLNDIRPVYIYPEFNSEFGINSAVNPHDVERAFEKNPGAKGVLITSPNYYGICSDIQTVADIANKYNGALIVDEAHGAHFSFSEKLPQSAIYCGADGSVQSAHKTLPCITQGALLHLGTNKIDPASVQENLNLLQTTSPSYLIMMTIDEAVTEMQQNGSAKLDRVIRCCEELKLRLNSTEKYKCLENDDPTRIVIHIGKNAELIKQKLKKLHNIEIEMCDGYNLVLIAKASSKTIDIKRLERALTGLSPSLPALELGKYSAPPKTELKMTPSEAYYSRTEISEPESSVGKVAARAVYKTPPCMSIISPGEIVTDEIAGIIDDKIKVVCND